MTSVNRRLFLQGAALAAITPVTVTSAIANSQSGRISISDAFSTEAQLTPLPFKSDKLDGISQKLIESHWKNNYGGSVRALNTIKERLDKALADDKTPAFIYNDLKREHLMRMGSVVLHEFYFGNMSPPQERDPQLDKALTAAFGSVKNWEKEFRLIGAGLGGGSGWVMLAWNTHTKTIGWLITCMRQLHRNRFWLWICTSIPITWITVRRRHSMLTRSLKILIGRLSLPGLTKR